MPDQPRNWDKELAEIDKIIAKSPAPTSPPAVAAAPGAAPAPARSASPAPAVTKRGKLATWLRVLLGVGLVVGMTQWPYFHACGTSLYLYLGALGVVVLAGVWGAVSSWRRRMGLAHLIALLVTVAGLALLASEVLPRIGYAKRTAVWGCP
jgi:hypothetical protein